MKVTGILAKSKNNVIGIGNKLPWYLPGDLKNFKNITINKNIAVGSNTFLTLPPKILETGNRNWFCLY